MQVLLASKDDSLSQHIHVIIPLLMFHPQAVSFCLQNLHFKCRTAKNWSQAYNLLVLLGRMVDGNRQIASVFLNTQKPFINHLLKDGLSCTDEGKLFLEQANLKAITTAIYFVSGFV